MVSLLLPVGVAYSSGRLDTIRQRGVLIVGVKTDYPPFGMLSRNGDQQGLEHDLAADLAHRIGVRLRTVGVTGTNRLQALEDGRVDVTIATVADTAERRRLATLIEPDYYSSGVTLMTPSDSEIRTWDDIRGKTVCANQGSYFNRAIATRYLVDLQTYANGRDAKLAMRDGRCVGWLFDNTAISGDLLSGDWHGYRIALRVQLLTPWAIAIARNEKGGPFERFIGDAVADWHRQGTLIELERRWRLTPSQFLDDMHTLWTRTDPRGHYLCSRRTDGRWPVACRNPAFITSDDSTGLRRWGLWVFEQTGVNLTFIYDDYERGQFLHALWLTVSLTIFSVSASAAFGVALALLCAQEIPLLSAALKSGSLVARTTPPLLQIYVLMFGVGSVAASRWGVHFNAFLVVTLSLSLYTGSFLMQVLNDAARVESRLTPGFRLCAKTLRTVIRRSSASMTALLVNVTKATMMASAVALPELLSVTTSIIAEHGNVATMMNTLMVCFLSLVLGVSSLLNWIERRWFGGER